MIKISILYPNREDSAFDMGYYLETHIPRAIERLGGHPGFRGVSVEQGLGGALQGEVPPFVAMCHFLFDSFESFIEASTPHAEALQGDIPNYTNIAPIIQVSRVAISR